MDAFLAQVGPSWANDIRASGDRVKQAYLPLLEAAPKEGIAVTRDILYGPASQQILDVYVRSDAKDCPVVAFVHGGAFVRGQKEINNEMYANVLYWFARQGCVGVNIEYRLAPQATFPAGTDDVALACQWISENIGRYGGDASRVCLMGHSAGGTHVASYVLDPTLGHLGKDVSCAVLISARVRADVLPENPNAHGVLAYFGSDPRHYEEQSPVTFGACAKVPVFIVNAEFENPLLDVYGLELAYRMSLAHRKAPRYLQVRNHNHVSIMAHFNTGEEFLGKEILDFFRRCQA